MSLKTAMVFISDCIFTRSSFYPSNPVG